MSAPAKHSQVVGRLAPSPTGELHLGHARSFLLAWWSARSAGGRIVLRWEDIGSERVRQTFLDGNRRDLAWLGMDWDGAEVVQSEHLAPIRAAIDTLLASGAVYPCICSRKDVRDAQAEAAPLDAPHNDNLLAEHAEAPYAGTCRDRFATLDAAFEACGPDRSPALRFCVEGLGARKLCDRVYGNVTIDLARFGGDFVIGRAARDGQHEVGYQIAVVIDDARAGVNEVVRGEDLLVSAARQEWIAEALELPIPAWVHVPLVIDSNGERLAKRTHSLSLETLRARGITAEQIVAWVAASCGLPSKRGPLAADYLDGFDLASLPRQAVVAPQWLLT